mgnify:CR=1 FL=1
MNLAIKKDPTIIVLLLILAIAAGLNFYGIDFPLGYHPDETLKVYFIQNNSQNFFHPIFILQVVRTANLIFGFQSEQQIAVLGRATTALMGVAIVFLTYKIAEQQLPSRYALGAALLTAVAPGMVMHSHYLKEDIALTFGILLSFLSFFALGERIRLMTTEVDQQAGKYSFIENIPWKQVILFGSALGLTFAAKYKSGILLPLYFATPLYVLGLRKLVYFKCLFWSFSISLFTFLVINFPILLNPKTFVRGFRYELDHALTGHNGIKVYPFEHFFSFHLRNSIVPSLTILPVILALGFLLYCIVKWGHINWRSRFLVCYVVFFYFVLEVSPLKPFPNFMRYMVPLIPMLSLFCMQGLDSLMTMIPRRSRSWLPLALLSLIIVFPLMESVKFDYYINRDTRGKIEGMLAEKERDVLMEAYVEPFTHPADFSRLPDLITEEQNENVCTLVASSFMYDRYLFGGTLKNQEPDIYVKYQQYLELFEYPYTEIRPLYKSIAFSNPTLRVIDLCE